MATLIGLLCYHERKNWRGRRQKSQVGKGGLIRKAECVQETGENQKINHCNYVQEHRGGLGQYE